MKKVILLFTLLVSTSLLFGEMTDKQKRDLFILTERFYPDTNERRDRLEFRELEEAAYDKIIALRDEVSGDVPNEVFDEIWGNHEEKYPGDFIKQYKEIQKSLEGIEAARRSQLLMDKAADERVKAANEAAMAQLQIIEEDVKSDAYDDELPKDIMNKIIEDAKTKHPDDYVAQKKEIDDKVEAYKEMSKYFDMKK